MALPRVLLLSDWFAPGYKGGGSQAAVANLVAALSNDFEFSVITRNHDLGDNTPYPSAKRRDWLSIDGARVRYLSPEEENYRTIASLIASTPHDIVHLNSAISRTFSFLPAVARRAASRKIPLIISPHGETAPKALEKKKIRKFLYLMMARHTGLFQGAVWHAASDEEKADIVQKWRDRAAVRIAPLQLPMGNGASEQYTRIPKSLGILRAIFLSRIDQMKNLDLAIQLVADIPGVTLDIYGPIGQPSYWAACQSRIASSGRADAFRYRGDLEPRQVPAVLSSYDLLLQPSQNENFGYTIFESLAAGCPVLISDRTPWRGLEARGIGKDIALEDRDAFKTYLAFMRDLDEGAHRAFRERAHSFARTYTQKSTARMAMKALYNEAIGVS
jgi:glycosyltransferase involved in cell wall biosynthesis